ncbi:MAG: polysaccharide biosynthesis/export family protein [Bryobacteraceae bacterium]
MKADFIALTLAVSSLTIVCAPSSGQTSQAPADLRSAVPTNPVARVVDTVGAAVDPNKYLIGPEDILFIKVWRENDFTMPVAVRPDGKITMPLVGEVQASGVTPIELTKTLTEQLTKFINNPDVTVFVTEVRSKKYYIIGEVSRQGSFPLATPTTVLEALSNAGGFHEFANTKKIKILRGDKVYNFNYNEVTRAKHMEQNIYLENGDKIIVH